MDDINSKLSQLYDNELNQDQLDDVLKNLNSNLRSSEKNIHHTGLSLMC